MFKFLFLLHVQGWHNWSCCEFKQHFHSIRIKWLCNPRCKFLISSSVYGTTIIPYSSLLDEFTVWIFSSGDCQMAYQFRYFVDILELLLLLHLVPDLDPRTSFFRKNCSPVLFGITIHNSYCGFSVYCLCSMFWNIELINLLATKLESWVHSSSFSPSDGI